MLQQDTIAKSLSVSKIIYRSFSVVWEKRLRMFQGLTLPILLIVAIRYFSNDEKPWIATICLIPIFSLFAVSCHRLVLLGDNAIPKYGLRSWTRLETRFVWYTLIVASIAWLFTILGFFITVGISMLIDPTRAEIRQYTFFYFLGFCLLPSYFMGRLSLVLPATAIGQSKGLTWSWKVTRGNGLKLMLLIGLMPFTVISYLPTIEMNRVLELVLLSIAMILEAIILSYTFDTLRGN